MCRDFGLQQGLLCDALVTNATFNVLTKAIVSIKAAVLFVVIVIDMLVFTGYYNCFKRLFNCDHLIFVSVLTVFQ